MHRHSSDIHPRSAALAVGIHLLLAGLLWWGATWLQPTPTEAELWDATSLSAALNQQPVTVPPQAQVNETPLPAVESKVTSEPDEIETKVSKERADKATPEKQPAKETSKPVQPTKPISSNSSSTRDATLGRIGSMAGTATSSQANGNDAAYIAKVKSMIENRGRNQGLSGTSGSVSFRVAPNGSVSSISVSITPADKKAVLENVLRSVNLPRPPEEASSRGMRFSVRF